MVTLLLLWANTGNLVFSLLSVRLLTLTLSACSDRMVRVVTGANAGRVPI